MYFPSLGDPVWLKGCPDQFVVKRIDHMARLAVIVPNKEIRQMNVPFSLLFAQAELESESVAVDCLITENILHASRVCMASSRRAVAEVRETIRATQSVIQQSRVGLAENDATIERMRTLDCNHKRWNGENAADSTTREMT